MTAENEKNYKSSQDCWICTEKLDATKVRDHCHITGNYRGAAHNKCDLNLKISKKLPIIFHNLEGDDGHIIFKELNNFDNIDIQLTSKTREKYIIAVYGNIIFLESLQFYKGSLNSLASNLEDNDFKHLLSELPSNKLEIIKRKDSYPYEWLDSCEKFNYQELPPKGFFYS